MQDPDAASQQTMDDACAEVGVDGGDVTEKLGGHVGYGNWQRGDTVSAAVGSLLSSYDLTERHVSSYLRSAAAADASKDDNLVQDNIAQDDAAQDLNGAPQVRVLAVALCGLSREEGRNGRREERKKGGREEGRKVER